ncbi:hypothetical protein G5C51_24595 [Streptomyces sp. A7024]|uniref:Uncharacterized protein n=1 Tax=Streptomyces coryli TaxID=1128680 RepID=A0A6G4U4H3_9ACTN|nr:hypothetical protein [Streptomyces coryli]NGN67074.1 hypothetical protein [Streptomyces coryli]
MTSREESDLVTRVATGVEKAKLEELWQRIVDADEAVFSLEELHILFSVLFSWECYFPPSEQDFYLRTGFFRENARDVATNLLQNIRDLEGRPSGGQ